MHCHCERPAWPGFDQSEPLCVDCAHKLQAINNSQFLQNAAMLNSADDDMDAIFGAFGKPSTRIPVEALAHAFAQTMRGKTILNNININNSSVGILNAGDLARIDAVITLTIGRDVETLGEQLKTLTQSVIDSDQLDNKQKRDALDLVQLLAEQVVHDRKPSVTRALLKAIRESVQGVAAIVTIVDGLSAVTERLFG